MGPVYLSPALLAALVVAAAPLGAAFSQSDSVPGWIKSIFVLYAEGQISDSELLAALDYLVSAGIISTPSTASGSGPADGKSRDLGDFYLVYGPNPNSEYEVTAEEWLKGNELLEAEVEWLNEHFRLPFDVTVSAEECGEINAFYSPGERRVIMCYEFVDDLFDMWYYFNEDDPDYAGIFAYDVTIETLYHEMGHALVDIYDLPYTGLEENVADQFSALILSYTYDDDAGHSLGQEMLSNVGLYYLYSDAWSSGDHPYWDTHGSDIQRFYNISCYAYGADPEYNQYLVDEGWLPEDRAVWCEDEYAQLEYAWSYLLKDYSSFFDDSA